MNSINVACEVLAQTLQSLGAAAVISVTAPCPSYVNIKSAPPGTTLDFTASPLVRLDLAGLTSITVKGVVSTNSQYYGIYVLGSSQISIIGPHIVEPGSSGVYVFKSDNVDIASPWISRSHGDGVDVGASTNVSVHDGACENNILSNLHPDCVQGWSDPGFPLQHITIQNMTASGQTQGFDVWDHTDMGAIDISIIGNHAMNSYYSCVGIINVHALVVEGNDCHSLTGGNSTLDISASPGVVISGNLTTPPMP